MIKDDGMRKVLKKGRGRKKREMPKKSREEKKSVVGEKCVNHHGKVIFTRTSIYRLEEVEKTEKDRPERSIFNFKKETRKNFNAGEVSRYRANALQRQQNSRR